MIKDKLSQPLIDFYENFSVSHLDDLSKIYHENIQFTDPFHTVLGLKRLKKYFLNIMSRVKSCRFVISDCVEEDRKSFIIWRMTFSHPSLNKNREIEVNGVTHLHFSEDGRVTFHRDYFDSSEMLFRHIPLMGTAIRLIEKRMS